MTLVVDASASVAWLFAAERVQTTGDGLRRVVREGAIVPVIWRFEVANAVWSAVRRRKCNEAYASRSLQHLARLPIVPDPESDAHVWTDTRRLATRYDLTVCDAAYLELAVRNGVALMTLDRALAAAAVKARVDVIQP